MTDRTAAQRVRCFLSVSAEEGADDDTPILDVVGFADLTFGDLTFGDLQALLSERDQLAEKLAVATRTVAALAAQQPQGDPQPHQERSVATPATGEPGERQFEPQQPAERLDAHKFEAIRRGFHGTWGQAHGELLIAEIHRLEQELASAYTADEDEHLTLRDIDPGYVHDCEEADRIADKYDERTGDDEEAPF